MTMMTDRDRINKEVYLGYATTISGPFSAGSPQADPSIQPIPSTRKARRNSWPKPAITTTAPAS